MSTFDFSSGTYNASTKVFTTSSGVQYYISDDQCTTQPLSQSQACNTQFCPWTDQWTDMADSTGKCVANCSGFYKQQFNLCSNGTNCDSGDGKTGAGIRYKMVPCGTAPCAVKTLSPYSNWSACSASCGGGTQNQTRSCQVVPFGSTQPPVSGIYLAPQKSITQPTIPVSVPGSFTNRYDHPGGMFSDYGVFY